MGININSLHLLPTFQNNTLSAVSQQNEVVKKEEASDSFVSASKNDVEGVKKESGFSFVEKIKNIFSTILNKIKEILGVKSNEPEVNTNVVINKNDDIIEHQNELYSNLVEATTVEEQDKIKAEIELSKSVQEDNILTTLYDQLANAKTKEEREKITADINNFQKVKKAEKFNAQVNDLQVQLDNCTSEDERFGIQSRIDLLYAQHDSEVMSDLYSQLQNAQTQEERDEITFEIESFTIEQKYNSELSSLNSQLANVKNDPERDSIIAQIELVKCQHNEEYSAFLNDKLSNSTTETQKQFVSSRMLDFQYKQQVNDYAKRREELYQELASTTNLYEREAIEARISLLNAQDDQSYLSYLNSKLESCSSDEERKSLEKSISDFNYKKEFNSKVSDLESQLRNAKTQYEKDSIMDQLDAVYAEEEHRILDSLNNDLKNATSETNKYLIQKEIQKMKFDINIDSKIRDLVNQQDNAANNFERSYYTSQIKLVKSLYTYNNY